MELVLEREDPLHQLARRLRMVVSVVPLLTSHIVITLLLSWIIAFIVDNTIIDNTTFMVDNIDNVTFIVVNDITNLKFAHRTGQLQEAAGGCCGGAAAQIPHFRPFLSDSLTYQAPFLAHLRPLP